MPLVTVLTPTYNRGRYLEAVFASLQVQTSMNFEWLIVDDGSTDDTMSRVSEFAQNSFFKVRYLSKENGGKHTALNAGIQYVETELVFIVDSDDEIFPDGIATIEKYYSKYKNVPNVGVWSFLRYNISQGIITKMPQNEFIGSYVEDRIKKPVPGDMAEVFLTAALKEFPFPQFNGERFLSEDVVWIPLGLKYRTVFINLPIYKCEYLADGLTCNDKYHKFASPLGSMMRGKMLMKKECGFRANLRGAIIYGVYKFEYSKETPPSLQLEWLREKCLFLICLPAILVFHRKWKNESRGNKK